MQKFLYLVMATLLALPMTAFAADQEDAMMSELQKQIQELSGELEELSDRLDGAERRFTGDTGPEFWPGFHRRYLDRSGLCRIGRPAAGTRRPG